MKSAEIISIGDELLIGQVINTNASWMAEQLNLIGIPVVQATTIGDDALTIKKTIRESFERADIVLITGGLGPTKDDITKKTLAEFYECGWKHENEVENHVREMFEKRGYTISNVNLAQADVPEKCTVLMNKTGTAPGMWFNEGDKILVSMPGVPYEMKYLMEAEVLPRIQTIFGNQVIYHRTILTQGVGESAIAAQIENWENELPSYMKLAYLPSPGNVRLRLSARGLSQEEIKSQVDTKIESLYQIIGDIIFGEGNETLPSVIHQLFKSKKITLSTAESCTGGLLAQKITALEGASVFFKGSAVVYTNEMKIKLIKVNAQTIEKFGAVSQETVQEMLHGALQTFETDYAIATSGFAGPEGGNESNPVGTIYIGVANRKKSSIKKLQLGNNRERNIEIASLSALQLLRKFLKYENN
jgi:nicotinamide-nucleotide amidase